MPKAGVVLLSVCTGMLHPLPAPSQHSQSQIAGQAKESRKEAIAPKTSQSLQILHALQCSHHHPSFLLAL